MQIYNSLNKLSMSLILQHGDHQNVTRNFNQICIDKMKTYSGINLSCNSFSEGARPNKQLHR